MRIYFDWEINFKQEFNNFICRWRGHKWEKFKVPHAKRMLSLLIMGVPQKVCIRCGEEKYKRKKMKGLYEWAK